MSSWQGSWKVAKERCALLCVLSSPTLNCKAKWSSIKALKQQQGKKVFILVPHNLVFSKCCHSLIWVPEGPHFYSLSVQNERLEVAEYADLAVWSVELVSSLIHEDPCANQQDTSLRRRVWQASILGKVPVIVNNEHKMDLSLSLTLAISRDNSQAGTSSSPDVCSHLCFLRRKKR